MGSGPQHLEPQAEQGDADAHPVPGAGGHPGRAGDGGGRQGLIRWSSSTRSTRATATTAPPALSTDRARPNTIRACRRSATSTRPTARSASRSRPWAPASMPLCSARIQNDLFDLGADLATPGDSFEPTEMTLRIVAGAGRPSGDRDRRHERWAGAAAQLHPARRKRSGRGTPFSPRHRPPRGTCGGRRGHGDPLQSGRRWPILTACPTICSSPVPSAPPMAATYCGFPARRAERFHSFVVPDMFACENHLRRRTYGPTVIDVARRTDARGTSMATRLDTAIPRFAASAVPAGARIERIAGRAAVRRRCDDPVDGRCVARPNGISRTRPGSSRPSCCAIMSPGYRS
jgi:hypothetical protein